MSNIGGRHERILSIYDSLLNGEDFNLNSAADYFCVSKKTIKRDIDDIRNFLSEKQNEKGISSELIYNRKNNTYYLNHDNTLKSKEIFIICKILLESKALCKKEFEVILEKLLKITAQDQDNKLVKDMIANENYHYNEPQHKKKLLDDIWNLSMAIKSCLKIKIKYNRLTKPTYKERVIEPVGIMFSDYYFYLIAFIPEKKTKYPTVYRIDRISEYEISNEKFKVPYSSRFEEGEFRKRVQFMYGGDLLHLEFKYYGESPEAILDRLPTAEIVNKEEGKCIFKAEIFGRGIKPWLLAQADKIEVLKPIELRQEMQDLISNMLCNYMD